MGRLEFLKNLLPKKQKIISEEIKMEPVPAPGIIDTPIVNQPEIPTGHKPAKIQKSPEPPMGNEKYQEKLREEDDAFYEACKDLVENPTWEIFKEIVTKRKLAYIAILANWNFMEPESKEHFIVEQAKYKEVEKLVSLFENGAKNKPVPSRKRN